MKNLERNLSLWPVIAIAIGGMLGSGLFVLPGLAAGKTGSSVWLAYLLAGFCILPAALSKSELATAMPNSGGSYVYIERAFGPLIGTIAGIGLWLSLLLKSSFALVGFGAYLAVLATVELRLVALIFLVLIFALNILGVKKVGNVQLFVVSISLIGLGVLMIFGIPSIEASNMTPFLAKGPIGLGTTTAFVFVSYAGVTKVAAIAGEIKNPDKILPIAMLLALGLVTIVYTSVTYTLVGNIPIAELQSDLKPIYSLAQSLGGKVAGTIAAVLGIVTLISMANSGVLAASRFPFAMSRDKVLPPILKKLHPKFLTPVVSIFVTCFVMGLVIYFVEVERIAKLASAFMVIVFMVINACVILLRETAVGWYQPPYKSPLYPGMQIFGILSGMVLLFFLGGLAILASLAIVVVGSLIFFFYGRKYSDRSGVFNIYRHRSTPYLLYKQSNGTIEDEPDPGIPSRKSLDGILQKSAGSVVPLFGMERSPEMLVEMGAALANGKNVQVVHLNEVPDITDLDAILEDDLMINSLNRRISAMSEVRKVDVDFESAATHDLVSTVRDITLKTECSWMVAGWDGKQGQGILIRNPIGWLVSNLDTNFALFKDNGVRYIQKIMVALAPGRNDPRMIDCCDRIAQFYGAEISLLRVVKEDEIESKVKEIKRSSEALFENTKSPFEVLILRDKNPVKAISEATSAYDLLIIGTPEQNDKLNLLLGTKKDKFAEQAACSVLRLSIT